MQAMGGHPASPYRIHKCSQAGREGPARGRQERKVANAQHACPLEETQKCSKSRWPRPLRPLSRLTTSLVPWGSCSREGALLPTPTCQCPHSTTATSSRDPDPALPRGEEELREEVVPQLRDPTRPGKGASGEQPPRPGLSRACGELLETFPQPMTHRERCSSVQGPGSMSQGASPQGLRRTRPLELWRRGTLTLSPKAHGMRQRAA